MTFEYGQTSGDWDEAHKGYYTFVFAHVDNDGKRVVEEQQVNEPMPYELVLERIVLPHIKEYRQSELLSLAPNSYLKHLLTSHQEEMVRKAEETISRLHEYLDWPPEEKLPANPPELASRYGAGYFYGMLLDLTQAIREIRR